MNQPTKSWLLLVAFILVAAGYAWWSDGQNYREAQKRFEKELQGYKDVIAEKTRENDSLQAVGVKIKERIAALQSQLDSNAQELQKAKNQLRYERRKFKEYTDAQKDSILRAFMDANQ